MTVDNDVIMSSFYVTWRINGQLLKSYIFCGLWALQGAEGVIVEAIGAGIHALEHIR